MTDGRYTQLAHWGAFTAVVEGGRFVRAEPFARDPAPSPMLASMPAMVYSATRIRRPAVRRAWLEGRSRERLGNDAFVEVGWDEALSLVAGELARVRAERGGEGIFGGSYGWSSAGRLHHARTLVRRLLYAGGGCVDQVGNYSWGAAQFLLPHVIGTYEPVAGKVTDWASVCAHTRLLIAFGGLAIKNGQVTSGGGGEHTMAQWLQRARARGIDFVVVSPNREDAPEFLGARWIPIRPNTDTALMLGMAHTLLAEGRHDAAFLARYCTGFETFRRYLAGTDDGIAKDAGWAETICAVPAATIRALAREAAGTRSMLTLAWSLQRAHRGEQPYWMGIVLAAMIGQIGLPGGGFAFGHGSSNGVGNPRPRLPGPDMPAGSNPVAHRSIPVARLTDLLESPGKPYEFDGRTLVYPDIGLVYWAGGNPFHHHQDLNRLQRAWTRPETVIVHETWWTSTARRADIVLPATTTLERNDIGGSTRDRFVISMRKAIDPVAQSRNDFDIFAELAERLGYGGRFSEERDEAAWLAWIWSTFAEGCGKHGVATPSYDEFLAAGHFELAPPGRDFVLFEDFRADPVAHPLRTPSGRIEIHSEAVAGFGYAEAPSHPKWLPPVEWLGSAGGGRHPLHLISVQPPDRLHSQLDPGPVAQGNKVAGRERLRMHPADAAARGIGMGDLVRIFNDRGQCLAGVAIDPGLMPGVLIMATGAWFDPGPDGLERAGNANVLSLDVGTSRLTQGPSAHSMLVEVERHAGEAPPARSYELPEGVSAEA